MSELVGRPSDIAQMRCAVTKDETSILRKQIQKEQLFDQRSLYEWRARFGCLQFRKTPVAVNNQQNDCEFLPDKSQRQPSYRFVKRTVFMLLIISMPLLYWGCNKVSVSRDIQHAESLIAKPF